MQLKQQGKFLCARGVVILIACCAVFAGCGSTPPSQTNLRNTTATNTPTSAPASPNSTATATQPPPPPIPTPFPVGNIVTYTNSAYHFAFQYPQNWNFAGSTTSQNVELLNYDPQKYQNPYAPPPLLKIEVDADANASHLSPQDFFTQLFTGPGESPPNILASGTVQLSGHTTYKVVYTANGIQYPVIEYLVADGDTIINIFQTNASNSQPSPVFSQVITSFFISG